MYFIFVFSIISTFCLERYNSRRVDTSSCAKEELKDEYKFIDFHQYIPNDDYDYLLFDIK